MPFFERRKSWTRRRHRRGESYLVSVSQSIPCIYPEGQATTNLRLIFQRLSALDHLFQQDVPFCRFDDQRVDLRGRRTDVALVVDARLEGAAGGGRVCQEGRSIGIEGHAQRAQCCVYNLIAGGGEGEIFVCRVCTVIRS